MRGIIIQDDVSIDEKRLRENAREVEHTRRAVEEVVDLRGVRILEYERNEGWLTATIQSPSFLDPVMLFVELPPDYPAKEPPRFFFPKNPGNRPLENLTHAVHDVAVVYQKNKRSGGRCLEDCLAFIAKALMNTSFAQSQHYPSTTYGTLSASSSMVFNSQGLDPSASFITPPGGSVMLGSTAFFPSESLSDMSETFTANTREDPTNSFSNQPSPDKGMSPTMMRIHPPLAMDDVFVEPISLEPQSSSPSTMENPSTPSPLPNARNLHHHPSSAASSNMAALSKRRSRCSASFAGGDAIVLFTSSFVPFTSSAKESVKVQMTWTWGSDSEDEDIVGKLDKKRTGGAKEVSHLSILPALVCPVEYDFYSCDNAQNAPSTIAKMAWNVLERCPDNALSRETMHVLIQKLKQSNDVATLAMLAARGSILNKVELLSMTSREIEHYKRAYGEQLQRQGRFNARCQLDKTSPSSKEGPLGDCQWTYTPKAKCGLCRLTVKGSLVLCNKCDHGGHSHCIANWFRQEDTCPTGCGCRCVTST